MIRLPSTAYVWATLIAGLLLLLGGNAPAQAHARHGAQPVVITADHISTIDKAMGHRLNASPFLVDLNATVPVGVAQPSEDDCCCYGVLCHAALPSTDAPEPIECLVSKALPRASFAVPLRLASGIERPPR